MILRERLHQIRDRLPPSVARYLTLHLIVGFVFSLGCLLVFADIAEDVFENDFIVNVDLALANDLQGRATPQSTEIYRFISLFGSQIVYLFSVVLGAYYLWRRRWLHLGIWIAAIAGGELLNSLLKAIFARPRPVFVNPQVVERFFSFPSGHAMLSMIAYGLLAYFVVQIVRNRIARIFVVFAAVLMIVLIGISRMALGVHYLSDVIAGYMAGGVWLGVCITAMQIIQRRGIEGPAEVNRTE